MFHCWLNTGLAQSSYTHVKLASEGCLKAKLGFWFCWALCMVWYGMVWYGILTFMSMWLYCHFLSTSHSSSSTTYIFHSTKQQVCCSLTVIWHVCKQLGWVFWVTNPSQGANFVAQHSFVAEKLQTGNSYHLPSQAILDMTIWTSMLWN